MVECYFCGISGEKEFLYDAISNTEIVKICEKCSRINHIPVINKPSNNQLKEADRPHTVYERLYKMAGLHDHKRELEQEQRKKENIELRKKEIELAQLMEKNLKDKPISVRQKEDLIDNFHWEIMRQRRKKGLSQKQLGEEIGESEMTIRMAEKAILPKEYMVLMDKLERKLNIPLKRSSQIKPYKPESGIIEGSKETDMKFKGALDFESRNFKDIKIEDLKKAKENTKEQSEDSENFDEILEED